MKTTINIMNKYEEFWNRDVDGRVPKVRQIIENICSNIMNT
jgi:uncharacterized protein Usg